uniref:Uncharacterized protein n=1 Tax=uncultured marine virus TaxID=186617 RepID=A0A0F7L3H7_9VIRU|nr:hypothetical protein [uncultured marine virus]
MLLSSMLELPPVLSVLPTRTMRPWSAQADGSIRPWFELPVAIRVLESAPTL